MIKGLEAFTCGQIQDALNVLDIMKQRSLTVESVREYVQELGFHPPKKSRRGFLRRTTKEQQRTMQAQRGMQRQPCKRCDEKRRGKK